MGIGVEEELGGNIGDIGEEIGASGVGKGER